MSTRSRPFSRNSHGVPKSPQHSGELEENRPPMSKERLREQPLDDKPRARVGPGASEAGRVSASAEPGDTARANANTLEAFLAQKRMFVGALARIGSPGGAWFAGKDGVSISCDGPHRSHHLTLTTHAESCSSRIRAWWDGKHHPVAGAPQWEPFQHVYGIIMSELARDPAVVAEMGELEEGAPTMSDERLQMLLTDDGTPGWMRSWAILRLGGTEP